MDLYLLYHIFNECTLILEYGFLFYTIPDISGFFYIYVCTIRIWISICYIPDISGFFYTILNMDFSISISIPYEYGFLYTIYQIFLDFSIPYYIWIFL